MLGLDAERGMQPPGIGKAGFAEDFRGADPQHRQSLRLLEDQAGERQSEAGDGTGIAGFQAMDFAERGFRQATAQGGIEPFDADGQEGIRQGRCNAAPDDCEIGVAVSMYVGFCRCSLIRS